MRTQMLGKLDIDPGKLEEELEVAETFDYVEPYTEFLCGRPWKSCMVWAPEGRAGDGVIAHYNQEIASSFTSYGKQMPYLGEVLESAFSLDHLKFARLAVMVDSVLIPHRDYVEFDEGPSEAQVAHRLHIPLRTHEECLFLEGNTLFQMALGEVWFLDVRQVHSAAVLSTDKRVHLILDFTDAPAESDLVKLSSMGSGIPDSSIRERPALTYAEREGIASLASVINMDNYRDVFSIVIKTQYRRDGGDNFFWSLIREIADRADDEEVASKLRGLGRYYLLERTE